MNEYQNYIALSRYARWRSDLGRRETWEETVRRLCDYWLEKFPEYKEVINQDLFPAIVNLEVLPSMRTLMTAGEALDRDNVAGYNCSYLPIDHPRAFDEMLYILMCGTGVGYSVERQYVSKLPEVAESLHKTDSTIVVADSKIGWASSFRELVSLLYAGKIPKWDLSKVRPEGAPLKTFGGRASGPEPLDDLFHFTVNLFIQAQGRKLTSIECHDLCCKVAEIVVVGGVRRSALISLSNLSDDRMRSAKAGQWWEANPQRRLANNSACYTEKPDMHIFMKEWQALYESKSGERGIFSRYAAKQHLMNNVTRRDPEWEWGTNPCSEILLRPNQFCNLSEVVVRPNDTLADLKNKVRLATVLGTFQSTLTNFRYLRSVWKRNTEEERLLGVSLTGIMDHEILNGHGIGGRDCGEELEYALESWLYELKWEAINRNQKWSRALGIPQSTAITCVKPSGTASQLVDSASGIHPRHAHYYVRRVRTDKKDPLYHFMKDNGFPVEDDLMSKHSTAVLSFPMKAPEQSVFRDDRSAIEQLELWKIYAVHWCEHKPSVTIYVKEHEWLEAGAWVYENFDLMSGVSFLPYDGGTYRQAPYEDITEEEYDDFVQQMPKDVDWTKLGEYESSDHTTGLQEYACTAGDCDL